MNPDPLYISSPWWLQASWHCKGRRVRARRDGECDSFMEIIPTVICWQQEQQYSINKVHSAKRCKATSLAKPPASSAACCPTWQACGTVLLCFSGRGVGGVDDVSDVLPLNTLSRYNEALKKKRKMEEYSMVLSWCHCKAT